jgi:hypothetical protein
MKVWLISFVTLFGLAELCQWMRAFPLLDNANLPMPVLIGTGLVLAIASNINKHGLPWQHPQVDFSATEAQSHSGKLPQPPTIPLDQIKPDQVKSDQNHPSISFTIHKHSFPQEP